VTVTVVRYRTASNLDEFKYLAGDDLKLANAKGREVLDRSSRERADPGARIE